jgi:hypothetical protein
MIEESELDITPGGGFLNDENIIISQQNASNASGMFSNLGIIEIHGPRDTELTILTNVNGFASQDVLIVQGEKSAMGFWNDLNGDTNVDALEVNQTQTSILFENGEVFIKNLANFTMATANFTDSEDDIINNGELIIINGGSGFTNGTITLTGQNSNAITTAQFTDTNIACNPPISGDWTIKSDCTLFTNETVPANVIVQNNSLVTILDGSTLNIDFTNFHLIIKSGSGILIKSGGKIT